EAVRERRMARAQRRPRVLERRVVEARPRAAAAVGEKDVRAVRRLQVDVQGAVLRANDVQLDDDAADGNVLAHRPQGSGEAAGSGGDGHRLRRVVDALAAEAEGRLVRLCQGGAGRGADGRAQRQGVGAPELLRGELGVKLRVVGAGYGVDGQA